MPRDLKTRVVVPIFKKVGQEDMHQLEGDHIPQPLGESLFQGTGLEHLTESQTLDTGETMQIFIPRHRTLDQFYTLHWVHGTSPKQSMSFMDLEKVF